MSRTGSCLDNAVAESWFASLKVELVHRHHYRTAPRPAPPSSAGSPGTTDPACTPPAATCHPSNGNTSTPPPARYHHPWPHNPGVHLPGESHSTASPAMPRPQPRAWRARAWVPAGPVGAPARRCQQRSQPGTRGLAATPRPPGLSRLRDRDWRAPPTSRSADHQGTLALTHWRGPTRPSRQPPLPRTRCVESALGSGWPFRPRPCGCRAGAGMGPPPHRSAWRPRRSLAAAGRCAGRSRWPYGQPASGRRCHQSGAAPRPAPPPGAADPAPRPAPRGPGWSTTTPRPARARPTHGAPGRSAQSHCCSAPGGWAMSTVSRPLTPAQASQRSRRPRVRSARVKLG
jgi:hypothetical protein